MLFHKRNCFLSAILWVFILFYVPVELNNPCYLQGGHYCDSSETCKQLRSNDTQLGECVCRRQFVSINGNCVPKNLKPTVSPQDTVYASGGTTTLWVVVPCLLLAVGGGVFFIGKRNRWLERLYQWRVRSYNTVLVSGMNDDDAPIT